MKLLRNEADLIQWLKDDLCGWYDAPVEHIRQHGPNLYPCYGYVADAANVDIPGYLYLADVEIMLTDLKGAA